MGQREMAKECTKFYLIGNRMCPMHTIIWPQCVVRNASDFRVRPHSESVSHRRLRFGYLLVVRAKLIERASNSKKNCFKIQCLSSPIVIWWSIILIGHYMHKFCINEDVAVKINRFVAQHVRHWTRNWTIAPIEDNLLVALSPKPPQTDSFHT